MLWVMAIDARPRGTADVPHDVFDVLAKSLGDPPDVLDLPLAGDLCFIRHFVCSFCLTASGKRRRNPLTVGLVNYIKLTLITRGHFMKSVFSIVLLASAAAVLCSCNKQDSGEAKPKLVDAVGGRSPTSLLMPL